MPDFVDFNPSNLSFTSHAVMAPSVLEAHRKGDLDAIKDAEAKRDRDMEPIIRSIGEQGEKAFIHFTTAVGHTIGVMNSDGGMWITVQEDKEARKAGEEMVKKKNIIDPKTGLPAEITAKPAVQIGTWSKNGKIGTSQKCNINGILLHCGIGACANMIAMPIARYLKSVIAKKFGSAASGEARDSADQELKNLEDGAGSEAGGATEGVAVGEEVVPLVRASTWCAVLRNALIDGLIGAAVVVVFELLYSWIVRDYYLDLRVYNFDKNTWTLGDWHPDNAKFSGDEKWSAKKADAYIAWSDTPWGREPVDNAQCGLVQYLLENDSKGLKGLGVGVSCTNDNDSSQGFALGYDLKRFGNNLIALKSGKQSNLTSWYDDDNNWHGSGAKQASITVGNLPVSAWTDVLSGSDTHVYRYYCYVGQDVTQ